METESRRHIGKRTSRGAMDGAHLPLTASRPDLLVDGSDHDFRKLVHRLLAFSARIESIRSGFGALLGLTGVQYSTLISIAHLQGEVGVGVKAIADHLGLSGAFLTIVTGQLVKLGLLEKKTNPRDRRRVHLTVTRRGQDLLQEMAPIQRDVNDMLFLPLDADRFRALNDIVKDLVKSGDEAVALLDYYSHTSAESARPRERRVPGRKQI